MSDRETTTSRPWEVPTLTLAAIAVIAAFAGGVWWILAILCGVGALVAYRCIPSEEMRVANLAAEAISGDVATGVEKREAFGDPRHRYVVRWGDYRSSATKEFSAHEEALEFANRMVATVEVDVHIFQHYHWPQVASSTAGHGPALLLPVRAQRWDPDESVWVTEWPTVEKEAAVQLAGASAAMERERALAAATASQPPSSTKTGSSFEN